VLGAPEFDALYGCVAVFGMFPQFVIEQIQKFPRTKAAEFFQKRC